MKRINLIPREARKLNTRKWPGGHLLKMRNLLMVLIIGGVGFYLLQSALIFKYRFSFNYNKRQITKLQSSMRKSKEQFKKLADQRASVEDEIKRINVRFKLLRAMQQRALIKAEVLENLSNLVPDEAWLKQVKIEDNQLTLVGTTFDNTIVSDFMKQLDDSPHFYDTSFTYTQKEDMEEQKVITFEVLTQLVAKIANTKMFEPTP